MSWQGAASAASVAPPEDTRSFLSAPAPESPFRPAKGTWFDPALDLRHPEGNDLLREVLGRLSTVENRNRKRRLIDERNHRILVRSVLANGLRCYFYRRPHLVAYSRKADGYTDDLAWLSGRAMARTVDLLSAAGLLDTRLGEWGETASTYQIMPMLYNLAQSHGITESGLTLRLPSERLVRLREGNSKTDLVAFTPNDDTRRWIALIDAYNAFLAQQDIALPLSDEDEAVWVAHWNKNRNEDEPCLYRPELIQTDLYRTFNHRSFENGGRLYGGWWINTPKALRPKITINGEPTVELDFSGCAIRMLYHERGIDYRDDPYWLETIAAYEAGRGLRPGRYREAIKAMTQALINDRDGKEPERIPLPDGLSFRPAFKRREVRHMIEEKHAAIADAFGTGVGLRLQRKDSDLALNIITELKEQGVVALPIHDSFITISDNKYNLSTVMTKFYQKKFGFYPVIK